MNVHDTKDPCPCYNNGKGCQKRTSTCHPTCKDYLEWAERRAKWRDEEYARRRLEAIINGVGHK